MDSYNCVKIESKEMREKYGIKMPGRKTQAGLALAFIYNKDRPVSKKELTNFLRRNGIISNDIQIGRHLKSYGWYVENFKRGIYTLVSLKKPHPDFSKNRRKESKDLNWNSIKEDYNHCCATCGCKEGDKHRYYSRKVKLQKGHKNPSESMTNDNIIPQCQFCNRQDKDRWIYDSKGRVIGPNNLQYIVDFLKKNGRIDELKELLS